MRIKRFLQGAAAAVAVLVTAGIIHADQIPSSVIEKSGNDFAPANKASDSQDNESKRRDLKVAALHAVEAWRDNNENFSDRDYKGDEKSWHERSHHRTFAFSELSQNDAASDTSQSVGATANIAGTMGSSFGFGESSVTSSSSTTSSATTSATATTTPLLVVPSPTETDTTQTTSADTPTGAAPTPEAGSLASLGIGLLGLAVIPIVKRRSNLTA